MRKLKRGRSWRTKSLKIGLSFSRAHLLVFILAFGAIGGYILLSSHAASSASVWVSTTGNDSTCVRGDNTKPCATLGKAYQIAQSGDIVQVASGTYVLAGEPSIPYDSTKLNATLNSPCSDSDRVTFEKVAGDSDPVFTDGQNGKSGTTLTIHATCFTFNGIDIQMGFYVAPASDYVHNPTDLTFENAQWWHNYAGGVGGAGGGVNGNYVTFDNVEMGPICCDADGIDISGYPSGPAYGITMDHLFVHDVVTDCSQLSNLADWPDCLTQSTAHQGNHVDCIQTLGMGDWTVENSRILNCTGGGGAPVQNGVYFPNNTYFNVLFENNEIDTSFFGMGCGGPSCETTYGNNYVFKATVPPGYPDSGTKSYYKILYNTLQYSTGGEDIQPGGDYELVGNILSDAGNGAGCQLPVADSGEPTGATWSNASYNIFTDSSYGPTVAAACNAYGANNTSGTPTFADPANHDWQLKAGSAGIDAIPASFCTSNPSDCPATDISGQSRPQGSAYDTGAYEYTPTANVWVSTTGDDSTCARGDSTKPCASFDKAYQLAQCGDVIQFATGTYPGQTINFNSTLGASCTSNRVTFEPEPGAATSDTCIAAISFQGSQDINFYGPFSVASSCPFTPLTAGGISVQSTAANQAQNITVDGRGWDNILSGNLPVNGAVHIVFRYIYVKLNPGGPTDVQGTHISNSTAYDGSWQQDDLLYDHMDWYGPTNTDHAADCIHTLGTASAPNGSVSVTNSVFQHCDSEAILLDVTDPNLSSVSLIENNVFESAHHCMVLGDPVGSSISHVHVLFNTCPSGLQSNSGNAYNDVLIEGNMMSITWSGDCSLSGYPGFTWQYNVEENTGANQASACKPTDTYTTSPRSSLFVNPEVSGDWHLVEGSPLIGAATGAPDAPTTDLDSMARPADAVDAGAYEYSSSYTPPTNPPATPPPTNPPSTNPPSTTPTPTPTPSYPTGDLNHDGQVDIYDLSILLSNYNHSGTSSADIDGNKLVNIYDLSILLSHYGG